jgi:two-component system chemotaxis sensor kinase CheA
VLSAQNIASDVIISVSDDGRGLDTKSILDIAARKGMLKKLPEEYSERDIHQLLMIPGFSTKETATEFSGRGVGLDIVRMNIERMGGSLIIDSAPGVGTAVLMKIPMTLAIIECMQIWLDGSIYSIPVTDIRETFKLSGPEHAESGAEHISLRGEDYPIVRLHDVFGLKSEPKALSEGIFIRIDTGGRKGCIFADELVGKFQVVVKPIPPYLKSPHMRAPGISGCTIMGNGDVSMVVDAAELLYSYCSDN